MMSTVNETEQPQPPEPGAYRKDSAPRHGRGKAKPKSGGRRALSIALFSLLGIGILAVAGVAIGINWLNGNIERIPDPFEGLVADERPVAAPTKEGEEQTALNVLILGSDSRISAGDPNAWTAGAQRTDAIMIAHLTADRKKAYVMSIPRDSWVPIPGHGDAKINAAFSYGGPTLMIKTVEDLTGIRIDHFAVADFNSFTTLTDALGGVEITLPEDTYDKYGKTFSAGTHTLNGEEALAYTRQRYGLPGGDFDRVKRQQNWLRAIMTQTQEQGFSNPVKMTKLVNTITSSIAIDDSLGLKRIAELGTEIIDLRQRNVTFLTAPLIGTGRSPDGAQSIVILDREEFDPLVEAIAKGDIADYMTEHEDELDTLGEYVR